MTRRVERLTLDNVDDLPTTCRCCLYWELDPVRRDRVVRSGGAAAEKEAWVSRVLLEWGSCGQIAYVDGVPAGYVIYAPRAFVPGADAFPTSPVSEDAVLMTTAMVHPEYAGGGLGRVLLQTVAKDLVKRREVHAIEAFGTTRPVPGTGSGCVLPADFLLGVGFKTHRAHPRFPRMRLELRSVLTWREEVEHALEKLIGVVAPRPARPAPESRAGTAGGRPLRDRPPAPSLSSLSR